MNTKNNMTPFNVVDMDNGFVTSNSDYEQYALLYPKNAGHEFNCYLKISFGAKKIFRKARGRNGIHSDELALAYRSQKELGVKPKDIVGVQPTWFLLYYLFNSDSNIKFTVWISLIGFLIAILSLVISVI